MYKYFHFKNVKMIFKLKITKPQMGKKLTHEYVSKYVEESGDVLKSTEYKGSKARLDIECKYCKDIYGMSFTGYQSGNRHSKCPNKHLRNNEYLEKMKPRSSTVIGKMKEITCSGCSTVFRQRYRKQKLCSDECRKKLEQLRKGTGHYENIGRMGGLISVQRQTRRSINEIYFFMLCEKFFENVLSNVPMFDGWDADVILPDLKVCVFWNGVWHYRQVRHDHRLEQVQSRDKIKQSIIEKHGYTVYIIADMGSKKKKFVEEEFLKFVTHLGYSIEPDVFEQIKNNGDWAKAKASNFPSESSEKESLVDDETKMEQESEEDRLEEQRIEEEERMERIYQERKIEEERKQEKIKHEEIAKQKEAEKLKQKARRSRMKEDSYDVIGMKITSRKNYAVGNELPELPNFAKEKEEEEKLEEKLEEKCPALGSPVF